MSYRDASFQKDESMKWTQLSNNTWVLLNMAPGSKTIDCKLVFMRKYLKNGTI